MPGTYRYLKLLCQKLMDVIGLSRKNCKIRYISKTYPCIYRDIETFDARMVRATRTSKQRIGWIRKTTTLHVQHTFLYTSMTSRHDYDVKMPNFTLYGGLKQTKKFSFSFWTWIWFLRISTSGEFAYIWQSKGVIRIIARTIERTRIHFLSDVFAAIALLGSSVTIHNILQGR